MRDRHRRLADAVDVGGFEAGIGHCVERRVGMQLDLRHVGDDAEPGGFGGADNTVAKDYLIRRLDQLAFA
jgi:hypothetical protein